MIWPTSGIFFVSPIPSPAAVGSPVTGTGRVCVCIAAIFVTLYYLRLVSIKNRIHNSSLYMFGLSYIFYLNYFMHKSIFISNVDHPNHGGRHIETITKEVERSVG